MAVTLADLAEASTDKLVQGFINEIINDSFLLDQLTFDDALTASGTSNLSYAYDRVTQNATAKFRALNAEPEISDVKVKKITTQPGILSDSWNMDRVAYAANNDLYLLKVTESKDAIIRAFGDAFINGDTKTDANGFDGLSKALTETSTEFTSAVDLSAITKDSALVFASEMDDMLGALTRDPDVLIVSRKMKSRMNAVCRILGINAVTMDTAGHRIQAWDGIPIEEVRGNALITNDVYAACLGMEDLHGITLKENAISVNIPDWTQPGAVKTGDAEFVCGIALKKTKSAGVLRAKPAATKPDASQGTGPGQDSGVQG